MFLSLLRRHEGWLSFALVLALLVAGFASFQALFSYQEPLPATPVPVAHGGDPTLAVYPDHGAAGAYLQVSGSGWPGGQTVTIRVADAQGRSDILATATTAVDGSLSVGFLYPFELRWLTPGSHTVLAALEAADLQATTPFLVSANALSVTVTASATNTLFPTATPLPATATPLPTITPIATVTPTPTPTLPATDTPMPPPVPTDTPLPPANQPPQLQAALLPIDIDDDGDAGRFQIQVTANDPEGSLEHVLIILKLPPSDKERTAKLKENHKTEIQFTAKRLEIKAPDPQALLDQINAYGGILVQNGQQIDLRRKNKAEGKVRLQEEGWRLEAPAINLEVIASDSAGLSSTVQVVSCLEENCPNPTDPQE